MDINSLSPQELDRYARTTYWIRNKMAYVGDTVYTYDETSDEQQVVKKLPLKNTSCKPNKLGRARM